MSDVSSNDESDIALVMAMILGTMVATIAGLVLFQSPSKNGGENFLPTLEEEPSKRAYELFALTYTPIWIFAFGCIVAFGLYERFDEWSYLYVCVGLALPFLLQPIIMPSAGFGSPDAQRPLLERYAFKANMWLAVYSFIGNYWYTHCKYPASSCNQYHYSRMSDRWIPNLLVFLLFFTPPDFYSVLKAKYTMPAHRLNNVPIALYFATHFYFSTYHVFSNLLLRKIVTSYQAGFGRSVLYVAVVMAFSYFTAFMETLTISAYPDYSFEDRNMAYTVGSAFYGIYFLVSFPAFSRFDSDIDNDNNKGQGRAVGIWETVVSSCGYGMMIMILLDFVRLYLDIPLIVGKSNVICSTVS